MKIAPQVLITLQPVRGGFVVNYPVAVDGQDEPVMVTEATTNLARAVRLVKAAGEQFSLVSKKDEEAGE